MSIETSMDTYGNVTTTIPEGQVDRFVEMAGTFASRLVGAPAPESFIGPDGEPIAFLPARDLERTAERLIAEHDQFAFLQGLEVIYLWKATGGRSGGSDTLGKCQKPSGLLRHFSRADFVIWLAADHIRTRGLAPRSIEGVLFHELCHCDMDSETGAPIVRNHDWAGFASEIEHYGLYLDDMRQIDQAMQQLRLPESR